MKKVVMILIFASCVFQLAAQHSINDYKYVIVEKQFHFQNDANEHNLNELTRFLFKKHGFRPILESDIFPDDLKSNYCLALQSEVKAKGFLKTTVTITLRDCNNNIIYTADGITKEKDFDKVYSYGIRKAFEDFNEISYSYVPNEEVVNRTDAKVIDSDKGDSIEVEKLKAEIEELKKEKATKVSKIVENTLDKKKEKTKPKKETAKKKIKKASTIFEAVAIDNGYKLLNAESKKVVYELTKTGMDNVFTVKGNKGLIYKKDGQWIREYTKGKKTLVEVLNIIF